VIKPQADKVLEKLALSKDVYSISTEDDVVKVRNLDLGSEYIVEYFSGSIQIRQAVYFDCFGLSVENLSSLYILSSNLNERFSGCKTFVDRWGVLVTAADVLQPVDDEGLLETVFNQVEFMSQATLFLVNSLIDENRSISDDEIDAVLESPSLQ
jgi:hypothetical protein